MQLLTTCNPRSCHQFIDTPVILFRHLHRCRLPSTRHHSGMSPTKIPLVTIVERLNPPVTLLLPFNYTLRNSLSVTLSSSFFEPLALRLSSSSFLLLNTYSSLLLLLSWHPVTYSTLVLFFSVFRHLHHGGLLGFSPTLCPSASCRPLGCIYPVGHPTLQSASAIAGITPVFLHFDSTTPYSACSYSSSLVSRYLLVAPLASC